MCRDRVELRLNYFEHIMEVGLAWPQVDFYYAKCKMLKVPPDKSYNYLRDRFRLPESTPSWKGLERWVSIET